MRKLFITKARENVTKNRKRLLFADRKKTPIAEMQKHQKNCFLSKKTQKKREFKTPFKISFRKHNFVLTLKKKKKSKKCKNRKHIYCN